jgi:hypothetical protein
MARQEELPAVAGWRTAAGQRNPLDRAMAKGKPPAGAAGPAGARAAGPAGAAERVFEGPGESPGARCEDLWTQDRAGVQRGCWAGRAADGSAGIRRARSWAPRVRPSRRRSPDLASTGPVSVQYCLRCRLRLLLISCKLTAASLRCAAPSSAITTPRRGQPRQHCCHVLSRAALQLRRWFSAKAGAGASG